MKHDLSTSSPAWRDLGIAGAVFLVIWAAAASLHLFGRIYPDTRGLTLWNNLPLAGSLTAVFLLIFTFRGLGRMRAAEERYRQLFESNPYPMWIYDADSLRILAVNDAACLKYGYNREEFLAMTILEFRPAEDREAVKRAIVEDGPIHGPIWRHLTKDGHLLEVEITSHRLTWEGRRARMTLARDLTEQRQVQAQLQRSEARLRALNDANVFGLSIGRNDGRIVEANDAYLRLIGYSRAALEAGRVRWDTTTAPEYRHVQEGVGKLIRSGKPVPPWRTELIRQDGSRVPVLVALVPQPDGAINITLDLTELRETERSREATERRCQELFERNLAGVVSFDAQGQVLEANPAFVRIVGLADRAALVGVNAATFMAEFASLAAEVRAGGVLANRELTLLRPDGQTVQVLANFSFLPGHGAAPDRIEGTVLDFTEYKSLEAQLLQAQKMEGIGQLAGGIAHDFNNLLTVINGYSDMLKRSAPENLRKRLDMIGQAGARAAALTRQLLAFSRKQVFELRVLDLNAVVGNYAAMLRRLVGEQYEVTLALAPDLPPVQADANQIEQVLMNLVVNARDAMPAGGCIAIETHAVELDRAYALAHPGVVSGRYAMMAVTDTGHGMDEATQARVFEPFFTTKPRGQGTGLGLATVFGIVKQSGGTVAVYSEVGKGTALKVYLPAFTGAAQGTGGGDAVTASAGHETILLVEDEDGVRDFAAEVLQQAGYQVIVAADVDDAIARCTADGGGLAVDLLVTDVVMPKMDGPTLATRLRRDRPGLRALFVSGYPSHAIVASGALSTGVCFLQKPYTPADLTAKVRAALETPAAAAPAPG